MTVETAYKIFQLHEWALLKVQGYFTGSAVDVQDGYIHLSCIDQVQGTLDKHYKSGAKLVIAKVDLTLLRQDLRYEVSRGGAKFPHLYADLPLSAISEFGCVKANKAGCYEFDPHELDGDML